MYKIDLHKRPTKETYKRDLLKRPTDYRDISAAKATACRTEGPVTRQKRPISIKRDQQKRPISIKRDLHKEPTDNLTNKPQRHPSAYLRYVQMCLSHTHCSTLQHTATHAATHAATHHNIVCIPEACSDAQFILTHTATHAATHCNTVYIPEA